MLRSMERSPKPIGAWTPVCFESQTVAHLQQRESTLRTKHPTLRLASC